MLNEKCPLFLQQEREVMKKHLPILQKSHLFNGTAQPEIESMLKCLNARVKEYHKNEFILSAGNTTDELCIVLSGSVYILKEDFWGNRSIMTKAVPGSIFAETYACTIDRPLEVSALAGEKTEVMFLDVRRILDTCTNSCPFHTRLIRNLITAMAQKNLMLNEKLTHMSRRNTRGKLLSYLSQQAQRQGSPGFEIPFNRQQLADYLSVDRSAMSSELCKMRDEGLIKFFKNSFLLIKTE